METKKVSIVKVEMEMYTHLSRFTTTSRSFDNQHRMIIDQIDDLLLDTVNGQLHSSSQNLLKQWILNHRLEAILQILVDLMGALSRKDRVVGFGIRPRIVIGQRRTPVEIVGLLAVVRW